MRYKEEITDNIEDALNDLKILIKLIEKSAISGDDSITRLNGITRFIEKAKERIGQA